MRDSQDENLYEMPTFNDKVKLVNGNEFEGVCAAISEAALCSAFGLCSLPLPKNGAGFQTHGYMHHFNGGKIIAVLRLPKCELLWNGTERPEESEFRTWLNFCHEDFLAAHQIDKNTKPTGGTK